MEEKLSEWVMPVIPWLLRHGVRIFIIAVGIFILNKIQARIITRAVRVAVVRDETMTEEAERMREDTLIRIFTGSVSILLLLMGMMMILKEGGLDIGPLLAGAGIAGLALGFGGQYLIKDVITGLFIILENQYRIGDVVELNGTGGLVEDITLRITTLRDMDGTVHYIPHGEIKKVSNLSKNFARVNLDISIAYNSDIDHVATVINRIGEEMYKDRIFKDYLITAPKFLRVDSFQESSIIVKVVGDTKPLKQWEVTGELRKRIIRAFEKERIEIPFPQRVIYHINRNEAQEESEGVSNEKNSE
jgi:small conductance mechanosensitive channel